MVESAKPNAGSDLLRIHRVITRGLGVAAERGAAFSDDGFPSAAIREGFLTYLRALIGIVDAHHLAEDEVSFPFLRPKMPEAPYDKLMADHQVMVGVLSDLQAAAQAVPDAVQAGPALQNVNEVVAKLTGMWHPHIAIEEALWTPQVAATLLTEGENADLAQKIGENSQKHLHAPEIEVPFVLYNLEPEDRAIMAGAMPPVVVQQLMPLVWRSKWAPMKPFLLT